MRLTASRTSAAAGVVLIVLAAACSTWCYLHFATPGRVSHDAFLTRQTVLCLMAQPSRVQDYLSGLSPAGSRFVRDIPRLSSMQPGPIRLEWVHQLPYEFTILLDEKGPDAFGVTLFVNDRPERRGFQAALDDSSLLSDLRVVQWDAPRFLRKQPQVLLASGLLLVPGEAVEAAAAIWPEYTPFVSPEPPQKHLLACSADNANGLLFKLHAALLRAYGPWGGNDLHVSLNEAWPSIAVLSLQADLQQDDDLVFDVKATLSSQGTRERVDAAVSALSGRLSEFLGAGRGFTFSGNAQWTGAATLHGRYHLSGFEARLRRALGG